MTGVQTCALPISLGALNCTSTGSTALAPCTMKKGVKPVELFGVVRRLHSTDGSSSGQAPAARSNGRSSRFFIPEHTSPLAFSTCPLVCGCATEAKLSFIPCLSQKLENSSEAKFEPLSVMMLCGTPKRKMMDSKNFTASAAP